MVFRSGEKDKEKLKEVWEAAEEAGTFNPRNVFAELTGPDMVSSAFQVMSELECEGTEKVVEDAEESGQDAIYNILVGEPRRAKSFRGFPQAIRSFISQNITQINEIHKKYERKAVKERVEPSPTNIVFLYLGEKKEYELDDLVSFIKEKS